MKVEELDISRRVGILDMFKTLCFKTGVEVGTDRAGYSKDILDRVPDVTLYTIDPYQPYKEGNEVKDAQKMIEIENEARTVLSNYPNAKLIIDTSMNAVKGFKPNSIDFVFIDGNHTFSYVYEDIVEWTKRVKPGGIVYGHDYKKDDERGYGVIEAVNKYAEEMGISNLFILKRGTFVPCWMFIKSWM